jgi:RHS repeat-associated protein
MRMGTGTSHRSGKRFSWGPGRRGLITVITLALLIPAGVAPLAQAASGGLGKPELPEPRAGEVTEVTGLGAEAVRAEVAAARKKNEAQAEAARQAARGSSAWPAGGSAEMALSAEGRAAAEVGGMPVEIRSAGEPGEGRTTARPKVSVLGQDAAQAARLTGVLLTAELADAGPVDVSVDYGGFASAVGGDWSGRLRLVELPGCVLTTPEKPECREQTPLASVNDSGGQTVTAQVEAPANTDEPAARTAAAPTMAVFAVTAASSGEAPSGGGDYSATPLAESATWEAGGSSGAFSWSYGFGMPPAAAGPVPGLGLSYDSGSVDGRTSTTNNQGSLVGEGFGMTESYVERSYASCDDDGHDEVYDRCWTYDNATLVLNGAASKIIKDDATGKWRLQNDDASQITRSTGADNGDGNGEYWTVTTGDGTRYVFGLNKLAGAGTERTNSVWTVPVFGDDPGEPGYSQGSAFKDRAATQAWRWNLDYVEDTSGNAMTYWYTKETNYYKKNGSTTANAAYTRGGYLSRIDFGQRKDSLFTRDADARVRFFYAERCTATNCTSLTKDTAENWPDVPFDSLCTNGDTDCAAASPSFFTRKRLKSVTTYTWDAASSAYTNVDSWAFAQEYLDPGDIGDTADNVLVLKSITRTGHTDGDIVVNPVKLTYHMRPNRVDGIDDILPITRPRMNSITSETGAITTVTYSNPECTRSQQNGAAEDLNTRNCFPQYWNINGATETSVDWFHKYRVTAIVVADPTGHNEPVEHTYTYSGAAWAYNHDPFTPEGDRTWSQWRGYRTVTTHMGNLQAVRTKTSSVYFQGMHGDRLASGGTRSVQLSAVQLPGLTIPSYTDRDEYSGMLRQSITYNGATAIASEVHDPWSQTTATQTVAGVRDPVARYVDTQKSTGHTYLTVGQSWRSSSTTTTFDSYGMPSTVEGSGDLSRTGDETCTRTWYARNAAVGITALASRSRTVARRCSVSEQNLDLPTSSSRRGDVLSDSATVYDSPSATAWTAGQVPTTGASTWTGRPTGYRATATGGERHPAAWQTTGRATHDALGRLTSSSDAEGSTTTTLYTPATGGPVTRIGVRNALGHTTWSFYDPRRAQVLRSYDINSKRSNFTYDALGRLTAVWQPNRNKDAGYSANVTFDYSVSNTRPSYIATSTLYGDNLYNTTYEIYDALLRPLQTQVPSPQGGRLLTDTRYNSLGQAFQTYTDIFDPSTSPRGLYARAEYGGAPQQHNVTFDAAGRETASKLLIFGEEHWTIRSSYTGDSTATSGVQGGTAQRVITDVLGNAVEKRTYNGPSAADPQYGGGAGVGYTSMAYSHHLDGTLKTVTGPKSSVWNYRYDLYGRQVRVDDPDQGTSVTAYNTLDQVSSRTNAKGDTVLARYDVLGRLTGTWSGQISDATQLTERTYDQLAKGQPDSAIRYVGGKNGRSYGRHVTEYDSMYRATASEIRLDAADPLVIAGDAPQTVPLTSGFRIDGGLAYASEPALGGMFSEIVSYEYNQLGLNTKVTGAAGYLLAADYSALGQLQQMTLGTSSQSERKKTYITNTFEEGTGRLLRNHVTDQTHPYMLQDLNYRYDEAGNVLSITDPTHLGNTSAPDNQCFAYDGQRRLTHAWTPAADDCATSNRAVSKLGGAAPYWFSYTYDEAGSRTTETRHSSSGNDTTTYCYAHPDLPKALTGTTTGGNCTTPEAEYGYDAIGNTTSRPGPDGEQDLDWTVEGRLAAVNDGADSTQFVYDADGTVLIRYNPDGESVLYAGSTELHVRSNGTTFAQRYYTAGSQTIAVRTNESGQGRLSYLAGDHHGTSSLAIDALTQDFVKRSTSPFGGERTEGATGIWVDDKGFLGKTDDESTGLTHIGARQYDPDIGRFISIDPIMDLTDPQQIHGYAYANNNPITFSDPTGLLYDMPDGYAGGRPNSRGSANTTTGNPGTPGNSGNSTPWANGPTGRSGGKTKPAPTFEDFTKPPALKGDVRPWNTETPTVDSNVVYGAMIVALVYMQDREYRNAFNYLMHWLGGFPNVELGEDMPINVKEMYSELYLLQNLVADEMREGAFDSGWKQARVSDQIEDGGNHGTEVLDWYYSLNGFQYRVQGDLERTSRGVLEGQVVIDVYKRYNFGGEGQDPLGWGPLKLGQDRIAALHDAGLAKDYDAWGRWYANAG